MLINRVLSLFKSSKPTNFARCADCGHGFSFSLIHNGFNDSAYAYCEDCGQTAVLSGWSQAVPEKAGLKTGGVISSSVEPWLAPCPCGGRFKADASPRCPTCKAAISAVKAADFIEASAPGASKGWRWQRSWSGLYAIVIDRHEIHDCWLTGTPAQ